MAVYGLLTEGLSNTTSWYKSSNVFTSRAILTGRLMYSRVVRFVESWIFITETTETKRVVRLCCLSMDVIWGTKIFFNHFERTDPWWWCVDSYESYESSIHEYSLRKPWKRNWSKGCAVFPLMPSGRRRYFFTTLRELTLDGHGTKTLVHG